MFCIVFHSNVIPIKFVELFNILLYNKKIQNVWKIPFLSFEDIFLSFQMPDPDTISLWRSKVQLVSSSSAYWCKEWMTSLFISLLAKPLSLSESCLSAIVLIGHHAQWPLYQMTIMPIDYHTSSLFSRLLSLLACCYSLSLWNGIEASYVSS